MTIPKPKKHIKVKICGITNTRDLNNCLKLNFEYIGFNFVKKSPRCILYQEFREILLSKTTSNFIPEYVAIVDPSTQELLQIAQDSNINIIQLYGFSQTQVLNFETDKELWLQLNINNFEEYDLEKIKPKVSKIVFDSPKTQDYSKPEYENNDIQTYNSINKIIPIILAGGINPNNLKSKIHKFEPSVVDICSGVEDTPTQKNYNALYEVSTICIQYNFKL
jgi:phosphoribosylanthranilate isomerase